MHEPDQSIEIFKNTTFACIKVGFLSFLLFVSSSRNEDILHIDVPVFCTVCNAFLLNHIATGS